MDLDLDRAITLRLPSIIKAVPDRSGRRLVEVAASTEEVDLDGDIVLQTALLDAAPGFLKDGHFDIDHYSEIGHRIGIGNPMAFIIGRPTDVKKLAGGVTSVVGEISRALDGVVNAMKNVYDAFWETLQRDPPVIWYSSIYGYPTSFDDCSANEGACSQMGATRFIIKSIEWRSLAFTRTPKNTALKGAARIVTAKSMVANLLKALPIDGSPHRPIQVLLPHHVHTAAQRIEAPTPAQAAAGNYPHGHICVCGLDIAIETPMGELRRGVGPDGTEWVVRMTADYGRLKRTEGADGDQVDIYLGIQPHLTDKLPVWIVDQIDADSRAFDEHKVMLGFPDVMAARHAYVHAFSDGRGYDRVGAVSRLTFDEFKAWLEHGNTTAPIRYRKYQLKVAAMPEAVEKVGPHTPGAVPVPAGSVALATDVPGLHPGQGLDTPPLAYAPDTMDGVWAAKDCAGCGIGKAPSLMGYRNHFAKCMGCAPGMADIYAHATMHKSNMMMAMPAAAQAIMPPR